MKPFSWSSCGQIFDGQWQLCKSVMRNSSLENFHEISNRIPAIVSYESCRPTACNFNKRGHDHWCFLKYFTKIFIAYILYGVSEHLNSCFFLFDTCDLCTAHWKWKHGFTWDIKVKKYIYHVFILRAELRLTNGLWYCAISANSTGRKGYVEKLEIRK